MCSFSSWCICKLFRSVCHATNHMSKSMYRLARKMVMYGPQIWSHNLKTRAEEGLGLGFTVRLKRVFFGGFFKCKALRRETSDDFIKKKAEDCKTEERVREREREREREPPPNGCKTSSRARFTRINHCTRSLAVWLLRFLRRIATQTRTQSAHLPSTTYKSLRRCNCAYLSSFLLCCCKRGYVARHRSLAGTVRCTLRS
jgi:hypothetical protein